MENKIRVFNMFKVMVGLAIMLVICLMVLLFVNFTCYTETVTVDLSRLKINRAIQVKSVINIITESERITLGGGVGVGIGSVEIHPLDLEQFIGLTKECSEIYTCIEEKNHNLLVRKYVAFPEDKSALFVYEEPLVFPLSEKGEEIKNRSSYIGSSIRITSFNNFTATAICTLQYGQWF
jgi:hypothetical protein